LTYRISGEMNIKITAYIPAHSLGLDTIRTDCRYKVSFKHPGYPDSDTNILFKEMGGYLMRRPLDLANFVADSDHNAQSSSPKRYILHP
jgi:hypothetical protein